MAGTATDFVDLDDLAGSSTQIRLVLEPEVLGRGETSRVTWEVSGAEEVRIWHTDTRAGTPEPLNWFGVFEAGEPVPPSGERELVIDEDTAVFVVVRAGARIQGERAVAEVDHEKRRPVDEPGCDPTPGMHEKMEMQPHRFASGMDRLRALPDGWDWLAFEGLWSAPPAPPSITMTAPSPVIFTDESSTVTWNVTDTNCVTTGETMTITRLVADPTDPSGSKYDGGAWGSGWTVSCGGGNPGSRTVQGSRGQRHTVLHVHASNAVGKSGAKSQWVDTLAIPKFDGNATPARKAWIRATLKKIDAKLREGRVVSDGYLDTTVKAFKKGCLTRQGVWARLLAELQNLDLVTIKCEDTQDKSKPTASWQTYSGLIYLRWRQGIGPSEYALCHELVHKVGFHQGLYGCGHSKDDIECGVDHVASAILGLAPDPC
jgi:hypothetical protein